MPVLRYFLYVGGALLALLLVFNAVLPQEPATGSLVSSAEAPTIRIHSDQKWPEPVVFDTSRPTIAPAPVTVAKADAAPAVTEAAPNPAVTIASPKARVREAFAQLPLPEQTPVAPEAKKAEVRPQHRHRVARARSLREPQPMMQQLMMQRPMMVAQQPHFGLFGNTW